MPEEEKLKQEIEDLKRDVDILKLSAQKYTRIGKMGFLVAKVFQDSGADLDEVYLVVAFVLAHLHSKEIVSINPEE